MEELVHELVRRHSLRLGLEVGENAMPQHWVRQSSDVLEVDRESSLSQCPRLAPEDEVLCCSYAGPICDPITYKVVCPILLGPRGSDNAESISRDGLGDGYAAHQVLEGKDINDCDDHDVLRRAAAQLRQLAG